MTADNGIAQAGREIAKVFATSPKRFVVLASYTRPDGSVLEQQTISVGYVGDFDEQILLRWARSGSSDYLLSCRWTEEQVAGAEYSIQHLSG